MRQSLTAARTTAAAHSRTTDGSSRRVPNAPGARILGPMRLLSIIGLGLVVALSGCPTTHDPEVDAASALDAGSDASAPNDASSPNDASAPLDAFAPRDAGVDAADPCPMAGAVVTQSCGMCGTRTRFCTSTLTWADGPCMGETGVCEAGSTGLAPCGRCGQQAQFCSASCGWVPMGACIGETGTCTPGDHQRVTTGCAAGQSRVRTCSTSCAFEDGPCMAVECVEGDTATASCPMCGTLTRTCDASGHWVDGACHTTGVCTPGATMPGTCQVCGTQTSTCSATCQWVAGTCAGGVTCSTRPPSSCLDASTMRSYDPTPVCTSGACAWTPHDTTCPAGCSGTACIGGAVLLDGLGGPTGYGPNAVAATDDGSSAAISLAPLSATGLDYYGVSQTMAFVNGNGNITFGVLSNHFNMPLMAPGIGVWFGDVDTTGGGAPAQNDIVWAIDGTHFVATWFRVGHYAHDDTTPNSFQLILTPRPDRVAGDFDVEMRYATCGWWMTGTGNAWAGFDSNTGMTLALPGAGTAAMLNLCTTSNVGMPGVWRWEVRNGIPTAP
jgi:hypothetical protein